MIIQYGKITKDGKTIFPDSTAKTMNGSLGGKIKESLAIFNGDLLTLTRLNGRI